MFKKFELGFVTYFNDKFSNIQMVHRHHTRFIANSIFNHPPVRLSKLFNLFFYIYIHLRNKISLDGKNSSSVG